MDKVIKMDGGKGHDSLSVSRTRVIEIPYNSLKDTAFWTPKWEVEKRSIDAVGWIESRMPESILLGDKVEYKKAYDELRLDFGAKVPVDELVIAHGNLLVNGGMDLIWDAVIGNAITVFSNANAAIGVGDSSTAAAVGQTNLQAATNKLRKGMNATFPDQPTNPSVRFQSDFTGAEANYAWLEVGTFNNTVDASGTMLHRLVPSGGLGTKSSGATWTITVTITLS